MLFSSVTFLYVFLPVFLLLYYLLPLRGKNVWLLIAGLVFYGWGEPKYLVLMAASVLVGYAAGVIICKNSRKGVRLAALVVSLVVLLGFLGYFKYADFFIGNFNAVTGLSLPLLKLALPIGISFYTFQIISYVIDVYRGDDKCEFNIVRFAAYVTMFPQLIAGPIVRYGDVAERLGERHIKFSDAYAGLRRFVYGLSKKVLVANILGQLCSSFRSADEKSVLFYWIYAVAFTLQIYFDFSAYSDMAIGLGKLLGFDFPENFDYPYISRSITEFWRRWHMTLSRWFRDYVYIPLGGNRAGKLRNIFNIAVVWLLTGMWHGAEWNFVIWGGYFALLLILEKFVFGRLTEKLPSVVRRVLVLLLVTVSFVIFNADGISGAAGDLRAMFALSGLPLSGEVTAYYLKSYGVTLAIAVVGCTPIVKKLAFKAEKMVPIKIIEPALLVLLLVASTAFIVDGSYNPFLYFRF